MIYCAAKSDCGLTLRLRSPLPNDRFVTLWNYQCSFEVTDAVGDAIVVNLRIVTRRPGTPNDVDPLV